MYEQEAAVCLVGALGLLGPSAACQPAGRQTGPQSTSVPSSGPLLVATVATGSPASGGRVAADTPDASVMSASNVADAGFAVDGGPGARSAGRDPPWPAPTPGSAVVESGVSRWRLQMTGNLDAARGSCQGIAKLHVASAEGRWCYAWRLDTVTCTGSRDVDWLHSGGTDLEAQLCYGEGHWGTTDAVPGRGYCRGSLRPRGDEVHVPPREIGLDCSWLCRGEPPGCVGEAQYTLTRLPPD
jgi:hypothetical protein